MGGATGSELEGSNAGRPSNIMKHKRLSVQPSER